MNRRRFLASASLSLGGATLVGLTPGWTLASRKPAARTIQRSTWTMGTLINLTLLEADYQPALVDDAFAALYNIDRTLSAHQGSSELSRLNREGGIWHEAGASLLRVSRTARHYGELTEGALDVTVLPILRAYGFIPGGDNSVSIDAMRERIDYTQLRLSHDRVRLDGGVTVDFGGIAKGYAVDESARSLRMAGVGSALLEAGGDLVAMGRPEPNQRWRIGIRDPNRPDALYATLDIEDEAVATSGLYAQTRPTPNGMVTHLINPKTGLPVRHILSSTIVAKTAMAADALATATAVMESRGGRALIESLPDTEGAWIYADGSVYVTSGLAGRIALA